MVDKYDDVVPDQDRFIGTLEVTATNTRQQS